MCVCVCVREKEAVVTHCSILSCVLSCSELFTTGSEYCVACLLKSQ